MSDLPPPPPDYGYTAPGAPSAAKAGPWIRFGARFIDGLVLVIPSLIVAAIIGDVGPGPFQTGESMARNFLAGAINTVIGLGYYVWFESNRGQTLGKMALGLRVHGAAGGNPTVDEALRRNLYQALALVPILGGFVELVIVIVIAVSINSDPRGQGAHDRFAGGTLVTRNS